MQALPKSYKWIAAVLIALYTYTVLFVYQPPFGSSIFHDMVGHWAVYDAEYMHNKGYMKGREDPVFNFYPNKPITRAELLNVVLRVDGIDTDPLLKQPAKTRFSDVPSDHWAASIILLADQKKLIPFADAQKSNKFEPDANVTRGELAQAIVQELHIAPGSKPVNLADIKGSPYEAAMYAMVSHGYASGIEENGKYLFKPEQVASRAEVAAMYHKALVDVRPENTQKGSVDKP